MDHRDDTQDAVRANNAFALALYQKLRRPPGNQFVSPPCIATGLALLHAGARGDTASEIAHVLKVPAGRGVPSAAYGALGRALNETAPDRSFQVELASALWVQDGYPLLDDFRTTPKEHFGLNDTRVDFVSRRVAACRTINEWTASRTGGKITGIAHPDALPDRTRLLLTTALYLRASWQNPFHREETKPAPFHFGRWKTVEVPLMNEHSNLGTDGYLDGGSFQALAMPCGSRGELSFVVVLPRTVDGLADLEAAITPESIENWWPRFRRPEEIIVAVPKFRLRAGLTLNATPAALGMPLAFEPSADFSGINGKSADLFLAAAAHSARLVVDENGIEATAATEYVSADAFGDEAPVFRADHPFLFLVRDNRTGCILFIGRVEDPLDERA